MAVDGGGVAGGDAGWGLALQETPTHMATKSAVERTIRDGMEEMPMLPQECAYEARAYYPLLAAPSQAGSRGGLALELAIAT